MRHKTFLVNPEIIKQNGINVFKCIQKPGEFVITFGGSYHAGFNMGFNCAEAVNFATKNWIDIGITAKFCKCHKDSVQIGMEDFVKTLLEKKIIKKKECESYLKAIEDNKAKQSLVAVGNKLSDAAAVKKIENPKAEDKIEKKAKGVKKQIAKKFGIPKVKVIKKEKAPKNMKGNNKESSKRVYKKRSK